MNGDEIIFGLADLLEKNLKISLDNPYIVRTYGGYTTKTVGGQIRKSPSISNTGNLRNQINVKTEETPDGIALVVDFGSAKNYAWFVENGRQPGKGVPPGVLDKWIMQRGLVGRDKRGRFITKKSFIFLINRSIKTYGYGGRQFIQNAINMSLEQIEEQFGEAAVQFVLDYLDANGLTGEYKGTTDPSKAAKIFRAKLL